MGKVMIHKMMLRSIRKELAEGQCPTEDRLKLRLLQAIILSTPFWRREKVASLLLTFIHLMSLEEDSDDVD